MENLLVNLLIAGALLAMDQVHRVSYQGVMVSREDIAKVDFARQFLTACEPQESMPEFLVIALESGWIDPAMGGVS